MKLTSDEDKNIISLRAIIIMAADVLATQGARASAALKCRRLLKFTSNEDENINIARSRYHGRWCPGERAMASAAVVYMTFYARNIPVSPPNRLKCQQIAAQAGW